MTKQKKTTIRNILLLLLPLLIIATLFIVYYSLNHSKENFTKFFKKLFSPSKKPTLNSMFEDAKKLRMENKIQLETPVKKVIDINKNIRDNLQKSSKIQHMYEVESPRRFFLYTNDSMPRPLLDNTMPDPFQKFQNLKKSWFNKKEIDDFMNFIKYQVMIDNRKLFENAIKNKKLSKPQVDFLKKEYEILADNINSSSVEIDMLKGEKTRTYNPFKRKKIDKEIKYHKELIEKYLFDMNPKELFKKLIPPKKRPSIVFSDTLPTSDEPKLYLNPIHNKTLYDNPSPPSKKKYFQFPIHLLTRAR